LTPDAPGSFGRLAGIACVILASGAVVVGLVRELRRSPPSAAAAERGDAADAARLNQPASSAVTTVYYFHGNTRCDTCLDIERQTGEAVGRAFEEELRAASVRLVSINYDLDEHRHFLEDYDLSFSSVVVVRGSRWENLGEVWTLVHDERTEFDRYVSDRVRAFVEGKP
jgi:hypothetical protein